MRSWWVRPVRGRSARRSAAPSAGPSTSSSVSALGVPGTTTAVSTPRSLSSRSSSTVSPCARGRAQSGRPHERLVALVYLAAGEQLLVGAALCRQDPEGEHPGGAPIEPVQGHELRDPGLPAQPDQGAGEDVRAAGHGRHVVGLVDHEQVLVAEEDRQRIGRHLLRAQLAVEPELVAGADGIGRRPDPAVRVDDLAGGEAVGQRGRRGIREGGEPLSEPVHGEAGARVLPDPPAHGVQAFALQERGRQPTGTAAGSPAARGHSPHTTKVSTLWPA